jgi:5'-deoxynucleotidase
MEEENTGNQEFRTAKQTIREALTAMEQELPEVSDFIREFIPSYGKTLDELS